MIEEKTALRARLRAVRDRFAAESVSAIVAPEAFRARLAPGMVVASYCAIGSEADPSLLAAAAVECGCTLALPHVTDRASPIRFFAWEIGAPLDDGPFGLRQPATHGPEVAPDVILTPLLGFDARLNRLGQGASHYDRAFARFERAWRVGIAWSVQQVAAIPTEMWDVPLHAVVTEAGVLMHEDAA